MPFPELESVQHRFRHASTDTGSRDQGQTYQKDDDGGGCKYYRPKYWGRNLFFEKMGKRYVGMVQVKRSVVWRRSWDCQADSSNGPDGGLLAGRIEWTGAIWGIRTPPLPSQWYRRARAFSTLALRLWYDWRPSSRQMHWFNRVAWREWWRKEEIGTGKEERKWEGGEAMRILQDGEEKREEEKEGQEKTRRWHTD